MQLWSDAFRNEGQIPLKYTKDGKGISPPLSWTDLPEQTRELALIFENITPQTNVRDPSPPAADSAFAGAKAPGAAC